MDGKAGARPITKAGVAAVLVFGGLVILSCETRKEGAESESAGTLTIESVCRDLSNRIVAYEGLDFHRDDVTEGDTTVSCILTSKAPTNTMTEGADPLGDLRKWLADSGFEEDMRYMADGPGTSSAGLRRDPILCVVSGGVPASLEEGEIVSSEQFSLHVICTIREPLPGSVF